MSNIANTLFELIRARENMSLKDFIEKLNITRQGYYYILQNNKWYKTEFLEKIKDFLTKSEYETLLSNPDLLAQQIEKQNADNSATINHESDVIGSNIRKIRNALNISSTQLAELLGVSVTYIYMFETGKIKLKNIFLYKIADYFKCEVETLKKQLSEENIMILWNNFYKNRVASGKLMNTEGSIERHDDDEPKIQSTFSINYYNNLTDFSNNSNVLTKTYDLQTLRIITNNKPVFDYSKIVLCRDNDITYICNIVNIVLTDKPMLCVIENKIDADNTTRFIASVRRDVLTNKIMLTIEGQQEIIIPTTCMIIGVVICRVC